MDNNKILALLQSACLEDNLIALHYLYHKYGAYQLVSSAIYDICGNEVYFDHQYCRKLWNKYLSADDGYIYSFWHIQITN